MSKTTVFIVSDQPEMIENAKKFWEGHDVVLQVFNPNQWRDGINNPFFRNQLMQGQPALSSGSNPIVDVVSNENIVPFPGHQNNVSVQKMEQLEAKAIENAIDQHKGNLTEAARALGIGRATLYRKVKHFRIDPSHARKKQRRAA